MKRLLAHSTIENMGIVAAGIGAAMMFLATGHRVVAGIALIAALYHLANHSVYKALLFVGTGAVEAGAGTRDLDRLGGIARRMPWTSAFFLVGVLSISALPPFNGFVSEWLTLQTILRSALLSSTAIKIVFADLGRALGLDCRARGHLLRQGFRDGLSRHAALGRGRRRRRGQPRRPGSAGAAGAACIAAGDLADLCHPGARSGGRAALPTRARWPRWFRRSSFTHTGGRSPPADIPRRVPRSRRASRAGRAARPGARRAASRRRAQPGRIRDVDLVHAGHLRPGAGDRVRRVPAADSRARAAAGCGLGWRAAPPAARIHLHGDRVFESRSG